MRQIFAPLLAVCVATYGSLVRAADGATEPARSSPGAPARALSAPDGGFTYSNPQYYPSLSWAVLQLLPSPEVGGGRVYRTDIFGVREAATELAFGLRWQLTPLLWSWGTNRRVSRWRTFVVDPLARNSGSIELNTTFEYLFGHVDRMLVRPGVRATFPLVSRGEYLSASIGTSTYSYNGIPRVAYDVGAYCLFGLFGVQVTVAPMHAPLSLIGTFRIRYF